jgi:DMSO reductase anchor subunit
MHELFFKPLLSTIGQFVIYAGILQGPFLALVLTAKQNRNRKFNRILAVLLMVLSLSILHSVFASKSGDSTVQQSHTKSNAFAADCLGNSSQLIVTHDLSVYTNNLFGNF